MLRTFAQLMQVKAWNVRVSPVTKQQPPKHISAYIVGRTDRSAAAICSQSTRLASVLPAIFWKSNQPSSISLWSPKQPKTSLSGVLYFSAMKTILK